MSMGWIGMCNSQQCSLDIATFMAKLMKASILDATYRNNLLTRKPAVLKIKYWFANTFILYQVLN